MLCDVHVCSSSLALQWHIRSATPNGPSTRMRQENPSNQTEMTYLYRSAPLSEQENYSSACVHAWEIGNGRTDQAVLCAICMMCTWTYRQRH
jgi:hypothetical protein